jgi:NhaP-type Na+/H+ or K+/H+ antiporter
VSTSIQCLLSTYSTVSAGWAISYFPHHDLSFDGHWFLRVLVPPIIFEAALSIDKRAFNRHIVPILLYSSIGTLFATLMTAVFVHRVSSILDCRTVPLIESMTFGALISSIDPIAVLSVLSNMGMSDTDTIYVLIFGESLLNDGVAIVLFETLLHFLDDNMQGDSYAVMAAGIHFMVVAIGSLLVGLGSGICCTVYYWLMHGCQQPLVEILTFCCWALLPYYVCDGIAWSGIVAVVAAGFVMDMYVVGQHHQVDEKEESAGAPESSTRRRRVRPIFGREGHLSAEAKLHIGFVTEILATMMETAIFAYLGLFLFSARYHWDFSLAMIAIVGCLLGRAVMIPSLSIVANWITRSQQKRANCCSQQLPVSEPGEAKQPNAAGVIVNKNMQLVLWFAGLRGAMSFALVESIPLYDPASGEGTGLKAELKAMTSACIIFTVFVLGGCTFYMMEFLGMTPSGSSNEGTAGEQELVGLLSEECEEPIPEDNYMNTKRVTPPRGHRSRKRIISD